MELIEANELAQMNTMDIQTYSKLILELDSAIASYKRTITKYKCSSRILKMFFSCSFFFYSHKHVVSASEKAMLQVCVRLIDQYNNNKK